MINMICPLSNEKTPTHVPRVTAFYVIALIISYAITQWLPIVALLLVDFLARASNKPEFSLISKLAILTSKVLNLKSKLTNKAPKIFAARLGFVMFALVTIFHATGLTQVSVSISLLVAVLATLECIANFCVGCIIYTYLVLPFSSKKTA